MKKNKFINRKMVLATLFVIGGSFAHATPSTEETAIETMMEWLIMTGQMPEPIVCNDFPRCPPDFAPEQDPIEKEMKEK